MSLVVHLRSGRGEVVADVVPPAGAGGFVAAAVDRDEYPLLRWVDPYSDTVFSQLQMRGLVPELERLERETTGDEHREVIRAVLGLAEQCATRPHHQLVFIGD